MGELIVALARQLPDRAIAALLKRLGKRTGRGNTWTQSRVCSFRNAHGVAVYRAGEMIERGELKLHEAAERLGVSPMTVRRMLDDGTIRASQVCKGAPWAIPEDQLRLLADVDFANGRPPTADPTQKTFIFSMT